MSGVSNLETRDIPNTLRADGDSRKIRGHAIVFNSRSVNLGGFTEIIRPEAVERTLREALDVRALVDHNSANIIGRTRAGTLQLRKDQRGLAIEIDPPHTTAANDILENIRMGNVTGMSFAFRVLDEEWREEEDGTPVREVLDMTISEVSIVTFPAYPATDVSVALRSLQQFHECHGTPVKHLRMVHQLKVAQG